MDAFDWLQEYDLCGGYMGLEEFIETHGEHDIIICDEGPTWPDDLRRTIWKGCGRRLPGRGVAALLGERRSLFHHPTAHEEGSRLGKEAAPTSWSMSNKRQNTNDNVAR